MVSKRKGKRTAHNSTLAPGKGLGRDPEKLRAFRDSGRQPLRRRSLTERYKDDPLRYGALWQRVRGFPCMGSAHLKGSHTCGPGYAPASAHHLGDTDVEGLIPACGALHDLLETVPGTRKVEEQLQAVGKSVAGLGMAYVRVAARMLAVEGKLPEEVELALPAEQG